MSALAGKVCAVFGFGPGLGCAAARRWASQGYRVALLSRSLAKVKAAEADIANSKGFQCDVTDPDDVEKAVRSIEKEMGPVDVVIYNAGKGVWTTFDKIQMDEFDLAMKCNVHGLLKVAQCVAPGMIERKSGCILVTGATASLRGKPFTAGFAPSKGGQRMLAQSLARDLGPKGVHVAYFIIDGQIGVDDKDPKKIDPNAIAQTYWSVSQQHHTGWTFELDIRPSVENW